LDHNDEENDPAHLRHDLSSSALLDERAARLLRVCDDILSSYDSNFDALCETIPSPQLHPLSGTSRTKVDSTTTGAAAAVTYSVATDTRTTATTASPITTVVAAVAATDVVPLDRSSAVDTSSVDSPSLFVNIQKDSRTLEKSGIDFGLIREANRDKLQSNNSSQRQIDANSDILYVSASSLGSLRCSAIQDQDLKAFASLNSSARSIESSIEASSYTRIVRMYTLIVYVDILN
jgi:hypothetical protein